MSAITITDLNNGKRDVDHIAAIATSPEPTATDRLGRVKPTIEGVTRALAAKVADVEVVRSDAVGKIGVARVDAIEKIGLDVGQVHVKQGAAIAQIESAVTNVEGVVVAAVEAAVEATAESAGIATTALATIRNLYYGAFEVAPAARPDGSARQAGDRYFDTAAKAEKAFNGSIWYVPNIDSSTLAQPSGSAGVGFIQAGEGASPRDVQSKQRERVSIDDFFLAGESDWTGAARRAIRYCENNKKKLHLDRVYVISDELFIRKRIKIQGIGSGSGYGEEALTGYEQISGFLVKGAGPRRIRTRQRWRGSASDPQDAPLSCAINVQAENCVFEDFTVFLDFDRNDFSPRNYGADWDVGIFIGCRVHQLFQNIHVMGYWRQAGKWNDVTRQTGLPQFPDPDGVPFEPGTVQNGGDGCFVYKSFSVVANGVSKWPARSRHQVSIFPPRTITMNCPARWFPMRVASLGSLTLR